MDSSASIHIDNFNNQIKDFVKRSAAEFGVAPGKSRAAVILFSADAEVKIKFGDAPTLKSFQEKVDDLVHQEGGATRIDKALKLAKDLFIPESKERKGVKKVALLLTDGKQTNDPGTDLEEASKPLHDAKVVTIAVGIGDSVDETELKKIAKSENDVVITKNYTDLQNKLLSIISIACDEGKSFIY